MGTSIIQFDVKHSLLLKINDPDSIIFNMWNNFALKATVLPLFMLLFACDEETPQFPSKNPPVFDAMDLGEVGILDAGDINFGQISVGETKVENLLLKNPSHNHTIKNLTLITSTLPSWFRIIGQQNCKTILPLDTCVLGVEFLPDNAVLDSLEHVGIDYEMNGEAKSRKIRLTASAIDETKIDLTGQNFGQLTVESGESVSLNLTISRGDGPQVSGLAISGTSSDFAIDHKSSTCKPETHLLSGNACTFVLNTTPTNTKNYRAAFKLSYEVGRVAREIQFFLTGTLEVLKKPIVQEQQGQFTYERKKSGSNFVLRYLRSNVAVSRNDFIELLIETGEDGKNFRELLNESIADLPAPDNGRTGYQLQAPVIDDATKNDPFYFIAFEDYLGSGGTTFANYLVHCQPAPLGASKNAEYQARFWRLFAADSSKLPAFSERIANDLSPNLANGAVVFKGGVPPNRDAGQIMVSPCPAEPNLSAPKNAFAGHIYTFAREVKDVTDPAKAKRLHSFWYAVGKTARKMFDGANVYDLDGNPRTKLFLSMHGHGVPYLHVRLEDTPRYYYQVKALTDDVGSRNYFQSVFP